MRPCRARVLVAVFAAALVGAGAPATAQQAPIKIGLVTTLTGRVAQNGRDMANGLRLALDQINHRASGREIRVIVEGASWVVYFEGKRWFEGNRTLVTNENVELPVLDGFRMLERLGDHQAEVRGEGIGVLAGNRAAILYHHVDAWWEDGAAEVEARFENAGRAVTFSRLGDSYSRWLEMDTPRHPSAEQVAALRAAAGLKSIDTKPAVDGRLVHTVTIPAHHAVLCEIVP